MRPLLGLIWKDAKVFAVDRQALVMSVIVPVLIATILGWLDLGAANDSASGVRFLVVDQDQSSTSKAVVDRLRKDSKLKVEVVSEAVARKEVSAGDAASAAILRKGFGGNASAALSGASKEAVPFLEDPSKPAESGIAEASFIEHASTTVGEQAFGFLAAGGSPLDVQAENMSAQRVKWAQSAHDFAGFGLQGLLFFGIESAIALARERRSGLWRRLRTTPVSAELMLLARGISSAMLALAIILGMFAVGRLLFGIRVLGSPFGFIAIAISSALVISTFGLLMSTVGKTETQGRALSILLIFVMLATGGAWFPLEKMPAAVRTGARFMPVRWAVEGFDATTWRGQPFDAVVATVGILLSFAVVFGLAAVFRFRNLQNQPA